MNAIAGDSGGKPILSKGWGEMGDNIRDTGDCADLEGLEL